MITLRNIADDITLRIDSLALTDSPSILLLHVEELIRSTTFGVIQEYVEKTLGTQLDTRLTMKYYPVYNVSIQDNPKKYVRFELPSPVASFRRCIGLQYVGTKNWTNAFAVADGFNQFTQYLNNATITPSQNYPLAVYDEGYLYVSGNFGVKSIAMRYIPNDPRQMPIYDSAGAILRTFDDELDEYPIIGWMKNVIVERCVATLIPELQMPVDKTINNNPNLTNQVQK